MNEAAKQAAHDYARRGWTVIQLHSVGPDGATCSCPRGRNCASKGKHPINSEWQSSPRPSGADIEEMWAKRPNANVGIATGAASGFWVLDIDPDSGGLESLQRLRAEHGNFTPTRTVRTGSGGWHFYYEMPDFPVTNSRGRLKDYPGIDVRGTGGQVVAPPSRTDKGVYTSGEPVNMRGAPAWLLDMIRPTYEATATYASDLPDRGDMSEAERRRLDAYSEKVWANSIARLRRLAETGWSGEPWDATTFEVACNLIELGNAPWSMITVHDAYDAVFQNAPRDPGFDDARVNDKFESARRKVGDKAMPMPQPSIDLFAGPDVRSRLDPTRAGSNPAGPGPDRTPGHAGVERDADDYFLKSGINVVLLANDILAAGPLGWGIDGQFWSYRNGVWAPDAGVVEFRTGEFLGSRFRTSHGSNVAAYLKHRVPRIECLPVEAYINMRNGMLDWRTGLLSAHSPDYLSTVQLDVEWDPAATCPAFDAFLDNVLEPDYIEMAWEMLGYMIYSGNPLQVAFMFYGSGGNGKGTLIDTIEAILGTGNFSAETLTSLNSNRFSGHNLFGKIANIAGDIDGTFQESTAEFKKLTGEDSYSAEKKFGDRFIFRNWAVPLFSANKIPGSADVTEGYLRRWIIFEFHRKFEGANRVNSLATELIKERNGIVVKAVPALRRLMDRGHFDLRGQAARAKDEFAEAIDQVRQWVSDNTVLAPEHFEPRVTLYNNYRAWADRGGSGKLKEREFYHRLEAIGFEPKKRKGDRGFVGLMPAQPVNQPWFEPAS